MIFRSKVLSQRHRDEGNPLSAEVDVNVGETSPESDGGPTIQRISLPSCVESFVECIMPREPQPCSPSTLTSNSLQSAVVSQHCFQPPSTTSMAPACLPPNFCTQSPMPQIWPWSGPMHHRSHFSLSPMYAPSIASQSSSRSACSCCCHSDTLSRFPTRTSTSTGAESPTATTFRYGGRGGAGSRSPAKLSASSSSCTCGQHKKHLSLSTPSPSNSTTQSPSKLRYGGRGGAGSQARCLSPGSPKGTSTPDKTLVSKLSTLNLKATMPRSESTRDLPPLPEKSASGTLAKRRGTLTPAPLVLHNTPPHSPAQPLATPPLTANSTTTASTGASESRTPRTPYFFFDDAFEADAAPPAKSASPTLSTSASTASFSRSLRRMASRTQEIFRKDLFANLNANGKASSSPPPPLPVARPQATMIPAGSCSSSSFDRSPSPSITSEWFDEPPSPPWEAQLASGLTKASPRIPPFVLELSADGENSDKRSQLQRSRSTSEATIQQAFSKRPNSQGKWNRGDVREVIVELRNLR
ncbi:hypothetical protein MKEN_01130400 [Mycena kentingensis (nom. inval.)]|nr:hypothetical protein MKEN_01130400 [Mycena kentingensis (nom. inval.)]